MNLHSTKPPKVMLSFEDEPETASISGTDQLARSPLISYQPAPSIAGPRELQRKHDRELKEIIADEAPSASPSQTQIGGQHYKDMPIQPAQFIHVNKIGFLEGNVIKYVCRYAAKDGKQDLLKARHYIDLLLEYNYDA